MAKAFKSKVSAEKLAERRTMQVAPVGQRKHRATYARDSKRPGGYLIRVVGPQSMEFEGRTVPVVRKDGSEELETLVRGIWSGDDKDFDTGESTGLTATLYTFEAKEKKETEEVDF